MPPMDDTSRNELIVWVGNAWWCPTCCIMVGYNATQVPLDHRCENYSGGKYLPTPAELAGNSREHCYSGQDVEPLRNV